MSQLVLNARVREGRGKRSARMLRNNGQIPAVFYGPRVGTTLLAVDYPELERVIRQTGGDNVLVELKLESEKGTESKTAILKELQAAPVKGTYLHADFYEISMDKEITVDIAVRLINTPVGVTRGGILQAVRRELNVSCLPGRLTDYLDVDVSGLDIGDAVHIEDIDFPEGITPLEDEHLTVAVVVAPSVTGEEAVGEMEAEEAEVEAEDTGESET